MSARSILSKCISVLRKAGGVSYYLKHKYYMRCGLNAKDPQYATKAVRLNLGCGGNIMAGWLNADLIDAYSFPPEEMHKFDKIFIMDARQVFPFRDNQFDFIYCEDFMEHFDQKHGLGICAECFRTLKPGGAWRFSTPDFGRIITCFELQSRNAINFDHWEWGHKLLYCEDYARMILRRCGYNPIVRCQYGESEHPELRLIDTRSQQKDWSLIIEATKPLLRD